jgi:PAS domain S-box-containing protein
MESTNAHLAYLDRNFDFVMVNSTYAAGSGHTKEELIGCNHFDLFPNEENEAIFKRVRDTGEPVEFKAKPFKYVDQPWRGFTYWDWLLMPVKDDSGAVQGLVFSLVDVTETVQSALMGSALNDINTRINGTLDLDSIMPGVLADASRVIGCETSAIDMLESGFWVVRYQYGFTDDVTGRKFSAQDAPFMEMARAHKSTVVINNTETDTRANSEAMKSYSIRSVLVVPLMIRDEVRGGLFFNFNTQPVEFTANQVDFANKLGASISLAFENARLFHDLQDELAGRKRAQGELAQARDRLSLQLNLLQRALLPEQPSIGEGYALASAYIPAFEGEEIGGDFYDVFETEDGKTGILIGDVSGKGIPAASLAAIARSTIHAFAYELSSAGAALTHANSVIYANNRRIESFVTVFLVILDPVTGDFNYCSAGHPPAAVRHADNTVEFLTFGNPPIGISREIYEEFSGHLLAGDKLVLYTDGVSEARHGAELFGEEGLARSLGKSGAEDVQGLLDSILAAVKDWARGVLRDDTAIIIVERCPDPVSAHGRAEETQAQRIADYRYG